MVNTFIFPFLFLFFIILNIAFSYYDSYNLLFPLAISALLFLLFSLLARLLKWKKNRRVGVLSAIIGLFVIMSVLEVGLRASGYNATYMEKNVNIWLSPYAPHQKWQKWFHLYPPNKERAFIRKEFSVTRRANSNGFLDECEYSITKAKGVHRIIALGDSFTEGVGATAEATWPKTINRLLKDSFPKGLEVMSCGIGGSDPIFEHIILKEKLIRYGPDQVIMMVNDSDINDLIIRGGMERFLPDSTVAFKKAPWFEPIYRISYLFRAGLHLSGRDYYYLTASERKVAEMEALGKIAAIILETNELCKKNGSSFLLVLQPIWPELESGQYKFWHQIKNDLIANQVAVLDLLECFKARGDMVGKTNSARFHWPIDRHFNTEGYLRVSECIAPYCIN